MGSEWPLAAPKDLSQSTVVLALRVRRRLQPLKGRVLACGRDAACKVAWAHPRLGSFLATCGQEGNLTVWRESRTNEWEKLKEFKERKATCCSWAPHEYGLTLAAGTSDGNVTIITKNEFEAVLQTGYSSVVTAVSWGSATPFDLLDCPSKEVYKAQFVRLATAGSNGNVKVWIYTGPKEQLKEEATWSTSSPINDVAFANNPGFSCTLLACCSADSTVRIWKHANNAWREPIVLKLKSPGQKLCWSLLGNTLTVSADNAVYIYEEKDIDYWQLIE
eukprot:TRINITY_DN6144_c0_g2_i4.p1 TRINITY_DN6144_c0_g2~~TRINITY_DN6144_c0_g2_i4.p1  ORF type:complete len:276 (-),score=30.31 TRINITY_DN6144_c0_g2_i4:127-954(-)